MWGCGGLEMLIWLLVVDMSGGVGGIVVGFWDIVLSACIHMHIIL